MKNQDQIVKNLLADFGVVLEKADTLEVTKQDVVPEKFLEKSPELILESLRKHLESHPNAKKTSIRHKLDQLKYTSPYQIYHDIVVACSLEISKHEIGTADYKSIDYFYKFVTELLLRETGRLGLQINKDDDDVSEDPEDVLNILREDFDKISKSYTVANGETIVYMNKVEEPPTPAYHSLYTGQPQPPSEPKFKTQPLFSSLTGKSALDTRNTIVPDPYHLAKVVGSTKSIITNTESLKSFGNPTLRTPAAGHTGGQVLDNFFHPNWYTLEAPSWLIYKQKALKPPVESTLVKETFDNELRTFERVSQTIRSFGPTTDLRKSVLSSELRNSVWFNHFGLKKLDAIKQAYYGPKEKSKSISETSREIQNAEDAMDEDRITDLIIPEANGNDIARSVEPVFKSGEIKLENLVYYRPEVASMIEELKKDKDIIKRSPSKIQKLISFDLLRLNKLRQVRFSQQSAANKNTPTTAEVVLYKKIMKLLTILLQSNVGQDQSFTHEVSKKIPVLLNEYPGVLPGHMPSSSSAMHKTARLAGVRGPYKKKKGFM